MPVFGKTFNSKSASSEAAKKSKDENLRRQLNQILQAKKQLSIQLQHWERIRRITKDPKELADIDAKLHTMRMDFLNFGSENF